MLLKKLKIEKKKTIVAEKRRKMSFSFDVNFDDEMRRCKRMKRVREKVM